MVERVDENNIRDSDEEVGGNYISGTTAKIGPNPPSIDHKI